MSDRASKGPSHSDLIQHTADIVAAYVGNNRVPPEQLPELMRAVLASLTSLSGAAVDTEASRLRPKSAVSPRKSVFDDYLICLEDGKKFKSLKRHLRAKYDMTPEQYREKWALDADYPMVAPGYSRERSKLAKKSGLGRSDKIASIRSE
jgi:predicted transcriptional regulator